MLVVRMMHIADMPSVQDILKNNPTAKPDVAQPQKASEQPVQNTNKITTAEELLKAMQADREILLSTYFSENVEVCEITDGKLNYFDRKADKDFAVKLSAWLEKHTGKPWTLVHSENSCNMPTANEHQKQELANDPMLAEAMGLFQGAEIVDISK